MSASSEPVAASVSISLNLGRTTVAIGTYRVDGAGVSIAQVIDEAVRQALADWKEGKCNSQKAE